MKIKKLFIPVASAALGAYLAGKSNVEKSFVEKEQIADDYSKMAEFYEVLLAWLELRQNGRQLNEYFISNGYKSIAIYGMKELGERLYAELKSSEIEVKYVIDKNADGIYCEKKIYTPDDNLEEVDVVVVTAIHYFDSIYKVMSNKLSCPIVSLEDVVYDMSMKG